MTRRLAGSARTWGLGIGLLVVLALVAAVPASAAPGWLAPVDLSLPGKDASNAVVAVNAAGRTVVLWERQSPTSTSHDVQFSAREPGGSFSAPQNLALQATDPEVAIAADGTAVAVWRHFVNPPGNYVIESATMPPGGTFSAPATVASLPLKAIPNAIDLAIDAAGDVGVSWQTIDPSSDIAQAKCPAPPPINEAPCSNPTFVLAAVRSAAGTFSAPTRISPPRGFEKPNEPEKERKERLARESALVADEGRLAIAPGGEAVAVWNYFDGEHQVLQTASRPPGGSWTAAATIPGTSDSAHEPEIAADPSGNATLVWAGSAGKPVVAASDRPAGGTFGSPVVLSEAGAQSGNPRLAIGPTGVATVVWHRVSGPEDDVQAVTRPAGGTFSSPLDLSEPGDSPLYPELATNGAGNTVVVWNGSGSGASRVFNASISIAGGGFSPPREIGPETTEPTHAQPAIDGFGDATVVWARDNGLNDVIQAVGFDAFPPELRGLAIPSGGRVGDPVGFSVSPFDIWPTSPASFNFGDGGTATGNSVAHVYTRAGTFQVTASVADGAGTAASGAGTITILPRGEISLGKLSLNRKKGTAKIAVTVDGPGTVSGSGKGLKSATAKAAGAGTVQVQIKAVGKSLKKLKKKGKLKATLAVGFLPDSGGRLEQRTKLTLIKKHG